PRRRLARGGAAGVRPLPPVRARREPRRSGEPGVPSRLDDPCFGAARGPAVDRLRRRPAQAFGGGRGCRGPPGGRGPGPAIRLRSFVYRPDPTGRRAKILVDIWGAAP